MQPVERSQCIEVNVTRFVTKSWQDITR